MRTTRLLSISVLFLFAIDLLGFTIKPHIGKKYLTYKGKTVSGGPSAKIKASVGQPVSVQVFGANAGSNCASSGLIDLQIREVNTSNGAQIELTSIAPSPSADGQITTWAGDPLGNGQNAKFLHVGSTWSNWNARVSNALNATFTVLVPGTYHIYAKMNLANSTGKYSRDPVKAVPNADELREGTYLIGTLIVAPPPPVLDPPSNIGQTGFTASWGSVAGATSYHLDVSPISNFIGYAPGYQGANVGAATSVNVIGLSTGSTYYFRVRAYIGSLASENSNVIAVLTIPAAPTAAAAANITTDGFTANWTLKPGATNYYLDVAADNGFSTMLPGYDNLACGNIAARAVSGLFPGITYYYYRVRSADATGSSNNSNVVTVVTSGTLPAPVANAASGVGQNGFTANWSSVAGATSYHLDVSQSSSFTSFQNGYQGADVGTAVSDHVVGLSAGSTYYYRVRAYLGAVAGDNSNTVTVMTIPATPTANAATDITPDGFTANWTLKPGATNYYLDIATDNNFSTFFPGYQNLSCGNAASYAVTGLPAGITCYYYRVRSADATGPSGNSNVITIVTSGALPPPANAASDIGQTGFTANWTGVSGATSYHLYVSASASFIGYEPGYQGVNVGTATSTNVTELSPGTTYYYRVRAYLGSTAGNYSNTVTVLTIPANPIAAAATNMTPVGFTANWALKPGATNYYLDVAADNAFSAMLPGYNNLSCGNVATRAVTGLSPGITYYYYRVRSADATGSSGNSNTITVVTSGTLPAPIANAVSNIGQYGFTANWGSVTGATSYHLDVSMSGSFVDYQPGYQGANEGTALLANVVGLSPGTTYYYRVRAFLGAVASDNSNTVTVLTIPATPTANDGSGIASNTFIANWTRVAGATNYYLDVATDNLFSSFVPGYNNLSCGNTGSRTVTGLTNDVTYYYRVRSSDASGISGNSNIVLATVTVYVPVPTASTATAIGPNSFTANWTGVTGATAYHLDVSTSADFSSFVPGYQNLDRGTTLSASVTGLSSVNAYFYRVRAYIGTASSINSNIVAVVTSSGPAFAQNYPSPFNPTTTIRFNLTGASRVRLQILNTLGQTIATLVDRQEDAGLHSAIWDASGMPSGVYFYRIEAIGTNNPEENFSQIKKMLLLK